MYSKVKLFGHPIHPMLIAFPVAFYTATLVALVVFAASENIFWFTFATICNWAGVVTAIAAAIPGFIDWATGIPAGTPAKARGRRHMVLNLLALTAFLISGITLSAQWNEMSPGVGWGILLSAIGVAITVPAGFIGWTLVQKDHVGVDLTAEQERLEAGVGIGTERATGPAVRPPTSAE